MRPGDHRQWKRGLGNPAPAIHSDVVLENNNSTVGNPTPEDYTLDNAMWAYQYVGALTTVYEFAYDDIVPLLDHLARMAEDKPTGNEGKPAVPGSVRREADAEKVRLRSMRQSRQVVHPLRRMRVGLGISAVAAIVLTAATYLVLQVAEAVLPNPSVSPTTPAASMVLVEPTLPPQESTLPTPEPTEPAKPTKPTEPEPMPTPTVAIGTVLVGGVASWVNEGLGPRYLALPRHRFGKPGLRVRICGAADCVVMVSTDAGPNRPMQRKGRICDLAVGVWERITGRDRSRGLAEVTVEYLDD